MKKVVVNIRSMIDKVSIVNTEELNTLVAKCFNAAINGVAAGVQPTGNDKPKEPVMEAIRFIMDMDIPVTDRLIAIDRFVILHKADGSQGALEAATELFNGSKSNLETEITAVLGRVRRESQTGD